jgi:ABC-type proline/glycine betaine transport system substrate-binding protein
MDKLKTLIQNIVRFISKTRKINMPDVRFLYLRNRKGVPVATVATRVVRGHEGEVYRVHYAIATHNPRDPFNRQVGMQVAEGRLNRRPEVLNVTANYTVAHSVVNDILTLMKIGYKAEYVYPERARKAAKLWLENHPED